MKTNDELIEEFRNGGEYWIEICDAFRMGDGERAHSLISTLLTQKDAEVARERERIVGIIEDELELSCLDDRLLGQTDEYLEGYNTSTDRWREIRDNTISLITNKGDTNK